MPEMFKTTMFLAVVALATPAAAQEAPAPAGGDPAAAPAPSKGAFELVLSEANRLASQGKYQDASIVYRKILDEGDEAEGYYQEAKYQMGVVLYQLKLYVSAFGNFDNICDAGVKHARYKDTLPWLVKIHRELPGETNSLLRMAAYPVDLYPADLAEEINFYVGQHHYYQGNLAAALQSLGRVGSTHADLYIKAMYMKGVVHVRRNEAGPASDAFKEVLQFVRQNRKTVADSGRMTDLAMTALARIFYSTGQFDTALRYSRACSRSPGPTTAWATSGARSAT
jgi:tetratricopeptide (TPR) repeat protein